MMPDEPVMVAIGPCGNCQLLFVFDPDLVPSLTIEGVRVPFCERCINRANASPERRAAGLPPIVPMPGAYPK